MREGIKRVDIERHAAGRCDRGSDLVAVEEPLEIRVQWIAEDGHPRLETVATTMRTPGQDDELAVGFLFTEGLIRNRDDIADLWPCRRGAIRVVLAVDPSAKLAHLERRGVTNSSCGVCGKTSAATLAATPRRALTPNKPRISLALLPTLVAALRPGQALFDATGGLHASALFDAYGRLLTLREDVGRHNALDKVIGAELLAGRLPADEEILIVSGRLSFELVQKARMAAIPVVAAIGAPSSMAVDLAQTSGMTLIGFLRDDRCNVYTDAGRVIVPATRQQEQLLRFNHHDAGAFTA